MQVMNFELVMDGVPYLVKALPFSFNNETRFRISYNGSEEYVFAYDSELGRYASLGDESINIPDNLEDAIVERIESYRTPQ